MSDIYKDLIIFFLTRRTWFDFTELVVGGRAYASISIFCLHTYLLRFMPMTVTLLYVSLAPYSCMLQECMSYVVPIKSSSKHEVLGWRCEI